MGLPSDKIWGMRNYQFSSLAMTPIRQPRPKRRQTVKLANQTMPWLWLKKLT